MHDSMKKLTNEPDEAYRLFMQYYNGDIKSVSELARCNGIPISTVQKWRDTFNWDKRVSKHENTQVKQITTNLLLKRLEDLERFDALLTQELDWIIKECHKNNTLIVSYEDLFTLLKSQQLLIKNIEKVNKLFNLMKGVK